MAKDTKQQETAKPEFSIQRLYVKDSSFEAPRAPKVFRTKWQPEVNVDLNIETNHLEDDIHEVVLKVTATAKLENETAFLVEVKQAGIFTIKDFDNAQFQAMLGSFCPSILFPYAREAISDLTMRGGFPPLYLAPINFEALYQQQLEKGKGTTTGTVH
jgi:preprotein translocase subunit SecB